MSVSKEDVKAEIIDQLNAEQWAREFEVEHGVKSPAVRSNRLVLWDCFSDEVVRHVEEYTVPQYGDLPDDNVASWSEQDCIKQLQKYINRIESNARGELESARDLFKIAHYASLIWCKRLGFEDAIIEVRNEMNTDRTEEVAAQQDEQKETEE